MFDDRITGSPKPPRDGGSGGVDMDMTSVRLESGMEYILQTLHEMKADMREMKADIRDVRGDIQRLSDKTDLRFERVDERFESMNEKIDRVNFQLNSRIDAQRGWYVAIMITIIIAFLSIYMTQG